MKKWTSKLGSKRFRTPNKNDDKFPDVLKETIYAKKIYICRLKKVK